MNLKKAYHVQVYHGTLGTNNIKIYSHGVKKAFYFFLGAQRYQYYKNLMEKKKKNYLVLAKNRQIVNCFCRRNKLFLSADIFLFFFP